MEEAGIVKNSRLHINYELLGFDLTAFLGIYLEKGSTHRCHSTTKPHTRNCRSALYNRCIQYLCKDQMQKHQTYETNSKRKFNQ